MVTSIEEAEIEYIHLRRLKVDAISQWADLKRECLSADLGLDLLLS